MRKSPFCDRPPPPAGRAGGGQGDSLLRERNALVPETRISHEIAQRTEILRIIRVELDRAHRLDAKQIGLASHPGGTSDEPANKCIIRGDLDGAVCGFDRQIGEIEAGFDTGQFSRRRRKSPGPLVVEDQNERCPGRRVSRLVARQPLQAIPRFCDRLQNGGVGRSSDHALHDAFVRRQLRRSACSGCACIRQRRSRPNNCRSWRLPGRISRPVSQRVGG